MSTLQHVFRKTAADKSKKKAKESDYELGLRHLLYPAQVAALQGMTTDEQVDANWGGIKEIPVAVPVTMAADLVAPGLGAATHLGVGPIIHEGTKSIFNTKAGDTSVRHVLDPARYVSYAGGTPEQQRQANWDHLKMFGSSLLGGGLGGTLGYLAADNMNSNPVMGAVLGALLGATGGHVGSFLYMLNNRKNNK